MSIRDNELDSKEAKSSVPELQVHKKIISKKS